MAVSSFQNSSLGLWKRENMNFWPKINIFANFHQFFSLLCRHPTLYKVARLTVIKNVFGVEKALCWFCFENDHVWFKIDISNLNCILYSDEQLIYFNQIMKFFESKIAFSVQKCLVSIGSFRKAIFFQTVFIQKSANFNETLAKKALNWTKTTIVDHSSKFYSGLRLPDGNSVRIPHGAV